MKKTKILTTLLFCLSLFACNDSFLDKIEIEIDEYIVGTWYCKISDETFVFNSDRTGSFIYGSKNYKINYRFEGKEVEVYNGEKLLVSFTYICGDKFTVYLKDDKGDSVGYSYYRMR